MKQTSLVTAISVLLVICRFHYSISAQVPVSRIAVRWGADLTMRLDTLTGSTTDSLHGSQHSYRIATDSSYQWAFFPVQSRGILVFIDAAGNVQNFAVKRYEFEYFNGNIMKSGFSNDRGFWPPVSVLEHHQIGDSVTITSVELLDLSGKPMKVRVPPFKIVKTR